MIIGVRLILFGNVDSVKNNFLIVGEKYCDGNPSIGFTNSFHNLFNTFIQSKPDFNLITLHLDEAESIYGVHLDNILPNFCLVHNIKIINFSLMNGANGNPSLKCLRTLKEMGIYLCFHWPDAGNSFGSQTINELGDIADLHLLWDNGLTYLNQPLIQGDRILRMWVPQDRTMYFPDNQLIPASFVGSTNGYYERQLLVQVLRQYFPEVEIRGGQRQESLSPYEYAKIIRSSKIGINFSNSLAQFWQIKGRVFEILASGSMLFEMNNPATESILISGYDYVTFDSTKSMVEKLRYYLEHDDERKKIAEQGLRTYNRYYTAQLFWDTIFARINKDLNERA